MKASGKLPPEFALGISLALVLLPNRGSGILAVVWMFLLLLIYFIWGRR